MKEIKNTLEDIALRVVILEPEDARASRKIVDLLTLLEKKAREKEWAPFLEITEGTKAYLEKIISGEERDTHPIDTGITTLQKMSRCFNRNEPYKEDIRPVLKRLGRVSKGADQCKNARQPVEAADTDEKSANTVPPPTQEELSPEDIQIINEFILESLENLKSIKINLVKLEEDPANQEMINAIFRPFHTIKGISGFMNFRKIHRLAHSTENLLGSVREGEFAITDKLVDIILESVDTFKKLILGIKKNLAAGQSNLEADIDVESLIERIETLNRVNSDDTPKALGEILIEKGVITRDDVKKSLEIQKEKSEKKNRGNSR